MNESATERFSSVIDFNKADYVIDNLWQTSEERRNCLTTATTTSEMLRIINSKILFFTSAHGAGYIYFHLYKFNSY